MKRLQSNYALCCGALSVYQLVNLQKLNPAACVCVCNFTLSYAADDRRTRVGTFCVRLLFLLQT